MSEELKNSISLDAAANGDGEIRLNLLFEIGNVLASVETMNEAAEPILELICRRLDFEIGELWCLGKDETHLHLESVWHSPDSAPLEKFVATSRRIKFVAGEGLPGKVWASNAPIWLENLSGAKNMPRRFAHRETGLQSGFAFPILLGERFLGAFSFFSRDARAPDDRLLQIFRAVGSHIGQFIKRERSESRLRHSEERYRAFIKQSTEGIWRFELDEKFSIRLPVDEQVELAFRHGYLAECNDAMARMYGLERAEELVGSRISDLLDMNDRANVEYLRSFIESGYNIIDAESHERDRHGADKYFLNSLVGTIENDLLIRVWGTQRDVTEIRRAENHLNLLAEISDAARTVETPEELLFAVSEAVGEHLQVRRCLFNEIDLENDCETVHRDYCRGVESVAGKHRISDYSPITSADMQAGKTVVNRDSQTDARTASDYAKSYEPNGERAYITVPLLRENRWVASIWVSDDEPRDWSAKEIHLLETVAERTWTAVEKLRINHALRESEEMYRGLFNSIDEGYCIIEMIFDERENPVDYRFLQTNPSFEKQTGLVNVEGRRMREIYPHHEDHWFEIYGGIALTGEPVRFENHAEQFHRWFDVYAFRFGAAENRQVAVLFNDITARKEIEIERERLLEKEQQARETAEQANYAKDEFIALVSHELRSPLNAMLGWTRILQNQNPDEETKAYALDVIIRNARSQSRLIEDLLDIARVGKGKLRVELEPTELIPIIEAAVETVKPAALAEQINLTQTLDRAADFINGDEDRLRQVIENLLSNAVKFTASGGSVEVRLKREGDQAKLTVSDTGQGFSSEFQPLIFERFRQADPSTTRRHGGLGIGLSLARDLVELHGGTISAESAGEDKGATFTVSLPLRVIAPINENLGRMEFMDSQGKLSGFWILAVDDEADARELVSFMLQINGAKVTTANSAVEALDILKNSDGRLPDILLSDISMPNESGYALLEKIRALPEEHGGQIPAVALTAFNRPEDREAAFDAGFQKHLGKPVEPDDLITAIIETAGK